MVGASFGLMPNCFSVAFEIGFDLYDDGYTAVGLLPQGNSTDGGKQIGRKPKLKVTFDE